MPVFQQEFPFEEIKRVDGNFFKTPAEANEAGYSLNQIWSVCEYEGTYVYGPNHHFINRLGFVATKEMHDGHTYYEEPHDTFD